MRLCLRLPSYGKNLPGTKMNDVFQFLSDKFPEPDSKHRSRFDTCLSETSLLISGLLEYQELSRKVLGGIRFQIFLVFHYLVI